MIWGVNSITIEGKCFSEHDKRSTQSQDCTFNAPLHAFKCWIIERRSTGCPIKTQFQNAAGATVHRLNHHLPGPLVSGDWLFGRFLQRLSRTKPSQVIFMIKFSPTAINFGFDFVLLVHFLGHPVSTISVDFQIANLWYEKAVHQFPVGPVSIL